MARIRSVKPEFWDSPGTARASLRARLFFIAMWNWADDWGVGDANAKRLMGFAFPNDEDISAADYPTLRAEVSDCFDVQFYEVEGRQYYCIPSWEEHQRTEKKARRANPAPDEADSPGITRESDYPSPRSGLSVTQPRIPARGNRGTGEEGTGEEGRRNTLDFDALFSAAYDHWPKKVERKEALARFKTATKRLPVDELVNAIIRFGDAYADTTQTQYVPALGVWLNGDRWTDALPVRADAQRKPTRTEQNLDFVARLAAEEQQAQRGIEA